MYIPKGLSEAVNQRRTDNAMTKRINNDPQKSTDWATQAPLKTMVESRF
jgi:hypothetical protein